MNLEVVIKNMEKTIAYKKVCVTGGSGFVGRNLRKVMPEWTYMSSQDCDLTDHKQVEEYFKKEKPSAIIHLAGRVGGIKENNENQADFYLENTLINTNVLNAAHNCNIDRILSSLSTCAFPNQVDKYPFEEKDFFKGPPAETNFSYGFTKRMLHVASMSYRKQYGRNYSTFCPSNLYGPEDHFGKESSHFIASLIHKVSNAINGQKIELWGTGAPLRQQLYVQDLCVLIPMLLKTHNTDLPLIVAPNENLSILDMANILNSQVDKEIFFYFNGNLDGQFRKDGLNHALVDLLGCFKFTKFEDGVRQTYKWYLENK
tara:strand:- start:424 stop:1368 length:945 start_codon:yes stop_codon:yes gene_type:complete